jgi:hypothetical protein
MKLRTRAAKLARRCASIVDRHHHPAMTWADWAAMVGEVRAVSAEADCSGLPRRRIAARLLAILSRHHDPETAGRLRGEFLILLEAMPGRPPGPGRRSPAEPGGGDEPG